MHLWSDYEGKTIADAYPLGQLIRPEGRSAFFATSNGTGVPAVIRLTESLNDEAEMIERWRQVAELNQEHLITIRKYGQTRFESTPLAYALMEPSDGSLAEILRERPLTPVETREVALSLLDALKALHKASLIHGFIEPSNVMAVGEVVKLRSDCVRECHPDSEFMTPEGCDELKRADVAMYSTLLLQALTLDTSINPAFKLPAPFDKVIPKGIDGSWGLAEIDTALNPPVVKPLVPPGVLSQAGTQPASHPGSRAANGPAPATAGSVAAVGSAVSTETAARTPAATATVTGATAARPPLVPPSARAAASAPLNVRRDETGDLAPAAPNKTIWIAAAAVLILLALIGWKVLSGKPSTTTTAAPAPVVSTAPAAPAVTPAPAPIARVAPASAAPVAESGDHAPVATSETQAGWHVIAYTYNHEAQAFGKVQSIRQRHSSLGPEVFAPSGRSPYLVSLGGALSEKEAIAVRARALRDGMPRDTFARHYGAR